MVLKLGFICSLLISNLAFAEGANTEYDTSCSSMKTGWLASLKYCVSRPKVRASGDIVYYFHGLYENEKTWSDEGGYQGEIRLRWMKEKAPLPTIVAISYGELWALAETNSGPFSGLLDQFSQKVVPSIEKGLGGLKGRRILFGQSMGGFNSIQAAMKTKLFSKAGFVCAQMADVSPFLPDADLGKWLTTTAAWKAHSADEGGVQAQFSSLIQFARMIFPSPAEFKVADPLALANRPTMDEIPMAMANMGPANDSAQIMSPTMKVYVSTSPEDEYASYEGNELFVKRLKDHGYNVEWHPVHGNHCSMDTATLAKFLVN